LSSSSNTIDAFTSRENKGGEGAKGANRLIMKWSTHGGDVTREYRHNPNRYSLNIAQIMGAFFAGHLQGNAEALAAIPKVHYYTMGADSEGAPGNEWRTADAWPPFTTTDTAFYLHPDGTLTTDAPTAPDAALSFTFDPANPVPTRGGPNLVLPAGPFDQREVIAGREDLLAFATAPLEAPVEITGRVTVKLAVSSDAPDTDFTAKLVDIYPTGDDRQILMLDSIRRVKTRLGYDKIAPPLNGPEDIVELEIDLQSISWIFNTGHRIGLHISSSNHPRFELNPNTGEDFPQPGQPGVKARNTIHLSTAHPSAIHLPIRIQEPATQ
jgi:putative CocE/NonD family hydrolase